MPLSFQYKYHLLKFLIMLIVTQVNDQRTTLVDIMTKIGEYQILAWFNNIFF